MALARFWIFISLLFVTSVGFTSAQVDTGKEEIGRLKVSCISALTMLR